MQTGAISVTTNPLLERFEAHYVLVGGGSISVRIDEVAKIVGRDGTTRMATPMQLSYPGPGGATGVETAWLGQDGRVVRWDSQCKPTSACGASVTWVQRGILPPLGINWPLFVHAGKVSMEAFDPDLTSNATWDAANHLLNVTSPVLPDGFYSPPGRFHYGAEPAPVDMVLRSRGGMLSLTRNSFTDLGIQEQAADQWPSESWVLPPVGQVLPGSNSIIGSWQKPVQDFLDALRGNSEAKQAWDSGCFGGVILQAPSFGTLLTPQGPAVARVETALVDLQDGAGQGFRWQVTYASDVLGGKYTVEKRGSISHVDCNQGQRAKIDWPTAFARARRFMPSNMSATFSYGLSDPTRAWNAKASPGAYDLLYSPNNTQAGLTLPPHIILSAEDGLLDAFLMPYEDLQKAMQTLST